MTTRTSKLPSLPNLTKASKPKAQSPAEVDTPRTPEERFVPSGDEKASVWDTFTPVAKAGVTAMSGWWGFVLGGAALVATTALSPVIAGSIGLAAGVAAGQAIARLGKSDQTKAEVQARKQERAQEPSSWKTSGLGEKAATLGLSGWLGFAVVGGLLCATGALPPLAAVAVGSAVGSAVGAGTMVFGKDSDRSESSITDDSSGLGLTADGKLGLSLGGGVVLGTDGKFGFGYEL